MQTVSRRRRNNDVKAYHTAAHSVSRTHRITLWLVHGLIARTLWRIATAHGRRPGWVLAPGRHSLAELACWRKKHGDRVTSANSRLSVSAVMAADDGRNTAE